MSLQEKIGRELLFFDGGMGTLLQERGLQPGELPELWNTTNPSAIIEIHKRYLDVGSDIILTNTFGANALKFHNAQISLKEVVTAAINNGKAAIASATTREAPRYLALDIGPTGKLLEPMGDLSFDRAYDVFKEVVEFGVENGVDLIHIETMSDTYEVKAAVLAAKENSDLPVFATMIFDEEGKLLTGGDVASVIALLEGLGVDALGINCGLGPAGMLPILEELQKLSSLPLVVKPNAGLPKQRGGKVYYDVEPAEFAQLMKEVVEKGGHIIGGCCGTTPEHVEAMINLCRNLPVNPVTLKEETIVSAYGKGLVFTEKPLIIGERINPTGKPKFKQALKEHNLEYILKEGLAEEEAGAHILDVNVGLPDIDEKAMMVEVVKELQGVTNLPLQIDTVDTSAMEAAMRIYNGKPLINSVNGKRSSMDSVFPLIKKYGGTVIGLTLDEDGIPETVEKRVEIAGKIIGEAAKYGIHKKDIIIDVLCMTVSAEQEGAKITLAALKEVKERFGVRTTLGVSNISFGLPGRPLVNATFYTMALQNGLSCGIINPSAKSMMDAYYAYCALMNFDENCENYIGYMSGVKEEQVSGGMTLKYAIEKGLKSEARELTLAALKEGRKPLELIDVELMPALDVVGQGFEDKTLYLPQLLMSADAAKLSFAVIREALSSAGASEEERPKVIVATVKGDIHDIGKNIVKVLLENYGFQVIDLGKDVPPEKVVAACLEEQVGLVGLSALMTTTVASMEETIKQLRKAAPATKIMVGGAVLNQEYADMIGADFYGKDAMQSVNYAKEVHTSRRS
ncbi:homocysteine S-methyltransferase family protein [Ohessyouella blattaphilus]|uniref:Methionine synthase n=1 Tax=Ohessyouella blattaphilus TaxID=2949333 RepID=A0ABT1EKJ8_9FIRM|nr:homocysteine S-methyltransferase family protein [Ohessyouella blattaphilus]MCP1111233.1 homocysteine S-methyltransferase family protein [Ohessyouella blattaphilus]MCR8564627.1 homocysteine S-methyltransferase family protein [Ohessyouella blattaphilus]